MPEEPGKTMNILGRSFFKPEEKNMRGKE